MKTDPEKKKEIIETLIEKEVRKIIIRLGKKFTEDEALIITSQLFCISTFSTFGENSEEVGLRLVRSWHELKRKGKRINDN